MGYFRPKPDHDASADAVGAVYALLEGVRCHADFHADGEVFEVANTTARF
jgi:hypothetical protein